MRIKRCILLDYKYPKEVTGSEINQRILYLGGLRELQPGIPTATEDFPMEKRPKGQAWPGGLQVCGPQSQWGKRPGTWPLQARAVPGASTCHAPAMSVSPWLHADHSELSWVAGHVGLPHPAQCSCRWLAPLTWESREASTSQVCLSTWTLRQGSHHSKHKVVYKIACYHPVTVTDCSHEIKRRSLLGRNAMTNLSLVQFSHSVTSDSLRPHELQHARPSCPLPTPRVHPKPCPLSWWCHPTISSSVVPFSSGPQSFPASRSFQMSQLFLSGGQSIGVSASKSVLPMNTQDWGNSGWLYFSGLQNHCRWWLQPWN